MSLKLGPAVTALLMAGSICFAQQNPQLQLKIDGTNRTLTVSAQERVTTDPEIAVIHIGFETALSDAKTAYAAGAITSNAIIGALKQVGIPETSIRSEDQHLERDYAKPHRFKLVQSWTVKTPPERAAEILDVAVGAGATESGQIEWTVKDVHALETEALEKAAQRAHQDAATLASSMGAKLGAPLFMSNEVASREFDAYLNSNNSLNETAGAFKAKAVSQPLAIEPRKVSRTATVYAVFAIE